jgi:hypothetical protein
MRSAYGVRLRRVLCRQSEMLQVLWESRGMQTRNRIVDPRLKVAGLCSHLLNWQCGADTRTISI